MSSSQLPSIFELLACDSLKDGLREAFRYILGHFNHHTQCGKFSLPPADETILLLDLVIEYNYLRAYNATYSENLYNLVRQKTKTGQTIHHVLPSLIGVTIIPYIIRKLDKYFEELNYKESRTADELRRIRIYHLLTRSRSFLNLVCLLRYSAGRSSYHNPLNLTLGIGLRQQQVQDTNGDNTNSTLMQLTSKAIADLLGKLLTVGSYVIQFLDYCNTHNNSTPLFGASLKTPDPPNKDDLPYTDDKSSSICLICGHARHNECALSVSGYVFCYGCIYRYVKSKHRCPVSGNPATVDNIVKLFTSAPS